MRLLIIMLPAIIVGSFLLGYKYSQQETEEARLIQQSQLFDQFDCDSSESEICKALEEI